jgi:hypothetical protein
MQNLYIFTEGVVAKLRIKLVPMKINQQQQ